MRASTKSGSTHSCLCARAHSRSTPRLADLRLRRRLEQRGAPVEPVDLDEDRARLGGAATAQDRDRAFDRHAPEIGGDPNVRSQPHGAYRPAAVAAAVRCLSRRGVTSVETGSEWARSKSRSAADVAALGKPIGLEDIAELDQRVLRRQDRLLRLLAGIRAQDVADRVGAAGARRGVRRPPRDWPAAPAAAPRRAPNRRAWPPGRRRGGAAAARRLADAPTSGGRAAKNGAGWRSCCSVKALTTIPVSTAANAAPAYPRAGRARRRRNAAATKPARPVRDPERAEPERTESWRMRAKGLRQSSSPGWRRDARGAPRWPKVDAVSRAAAAPRPGFSSGRQTSGNRAVTRVPTPANAFERQSAAVQSDQTAHQRQSQSRAFETAIVVGANLKEGVAEPRQEFGGNADAGVRDMNMHAVADDVGADGDAAARLGEFHRVRQAD